MGLDQYLYRQFDPTRPVITDPEEGNSIWVIEREKFGAVDHAADDDSPHSYASWKRHLGAALNNEEVHYWRKFNALHAWVEQNANNGRGTNCELIPLSLEQLAGLQVTCERAAADPATVGARDLPTAAGFFFGGGEYGEWYVEQCSTTAKRLAELIEEERQWVAAGNKPRQFFYDSSW